MSDPRVSAPPPKTKVDWPRVLDKAMENPGEWVLVPTTLNKSVASAITAGRYRAVDCDKYEVTTRQAIGEGPTRVNIWIRTR